MTFDRSLKRRQRNGGLSEEVQYLRRTVAERLVERMRDISGTFPRMLDIGCHTGHVQRQLVNQKQHVRVLWQCDFAEKALEEGKRLNKDLEQHFDEVQWHLADEEDLGTFCEAESFDVVTSSLALHWTNDLPLALVNARAVLKPDGCFIGALLGGNTLEEFQASFAAAEEERTGGLGPHASPSTRVSDCGGLMQAAGFNLITIDVDKIVVDYSDPFVLLDDLQTMGEQHAPFFQSPPVSRDTFLAMASTYSHIYGEQHSDDQPMTIPATFDVIYMIGWAPSKSQPSPLPRGSATAQFRDVISDSSSSSDSSER